MENWSTSLRGSPYDPPELMILTLVGQVYGHKEERHYDGKWIRTSEIVKVEGRTLTTGSGSVYHLGSIDPKFRRWLKKNVPDWDWRNPVVTKEPPHAE